MSATESQATHKCIDKSQYSEVRFYPEKRFYICTKSDIRTCTCDPDKSADPKFITPPLSLVR